MEINLKDKTAFITGGSHGIGLSIGLLLGSYGCDIIFISRTKKNLFSAKNLYIKNNINVDAYQCDVLNKDKVRTLIKEINKKYNRIDILINNVGGGGRWGSHDILETKIKTWDEVYEKNLNTCRNFTLSFLPKMIRSKWGRVITITSTLGLEIGGRPWFNVAKVSQTIFSKNLSKDKKFARAGITFNCIAPGPIDIPGTGWDKTDKDKLPKINEYVDENIPIGKLGSPDDIANICLFLCSNYASYITGSNIVVDGGLSSSI